MSTDDHSTETWWIRDTSPEPNDTAPKKMCRVCMRHPIGVADRPDPDCQMCRGRGTMPGLGGVPDNITINIEPNPGESWSDLASPGPDSSSSYAETTQVFWNQRQI